MTAEDQRRLRRGDNGLWHAYAVTYRLLPHWERRTAGSVA